MNTKLAANVDHSDEFTLLRAGAWLCRQAKFLRGQEFALFCIASLLTYLGFFAEAIPFAIAYIPILLAVMFISPRNKFLCLTAHFMWPAIISGWGLIQLGHTTALVVPVFICLTILISWSLVKITIGVGTLALGLIPFFPASPLLITGDIFSNTGIVGLMLFPVVLLLVETIRSNRKKIAIVSTVLFVACLLRVEGIGTQVGSILIANSTDSLPQYTQVSTSEIKAITKTGHWRGLEKRIPKNATVILGENIISHDDPAARSFWCRVARNKNTQIYVGVRGAHDIGEVWLFGSTHCLNPKRIYAAQVGIPTVSGFWTPNISHWSAWLSPGQTSLPFAKQSPPEWIACFEGFSIFRWVGMARTNANHVVVIANDKWTDPLNVSLLRRKASQAFGNLFNLDVVYAETGENLLVKSGASK